MLEPKAAIDHWKAKGFDFSNILYAPDASPDVGRFQTIAQDHGIDRSLDVQKLLILSPFDPFTTLFNLAKLTQERAITVPQ